MTRILHAPEPFEVPLSGADPRMLAMTPPERWFMLPSDPVPHLRNVTRPSLTAYLPKRARATGTGVVICPGGGHQMLCMVRQGEDVAHWLRRHGVAAFVLKYTLRPTSADDTAFLTQFQELSLMPEVLRQVAQQQAPTVLSDGHRAMAVVRAHAREWDLPPDRIGMLGFGAGGHVAGLVATQHDGCSRPDFVASILGLHPEEPQVPEDAPPLFAVYDHEGPGREPLPGSFKLLKAWRLAGRQAEGHAVSRGGCSAGLHRQHLPMEAWAEPFFKWLLAPQLASGQSE